MNKKKIANLAPYGYITPITVILIGFVIVSVIISIVLSFTRYNIMTPPTFYGLKNYERLVTDTKFMKALFNTLKLMVMIVPLQMILSLIVSVFLAVETFFGLFGIKASMLLGNAKTALAVVAAVAIWKMLGYYVVIYSSGLLGISESFYEAAKVDGAGTVTRFFRITLPMLKPTIILAVFLSITSSLQCFDLIYTMTGGGPNNASTTLVIYAYSLCFAGSSSAGYAMAVSNILFVVILVIAMLQRGMMKREASEI